LNYLPFTGAWFYGVITEEQRAAFYCSWGLLEVAPVPPVGGGWREQGILSMLL